MSNNNHSISLLDQQTVHYLKSIGYTKAEIMDALGMSLSSVKRILRKDLSDIHTSINSADYITPPETGCYYSNGQYQEECLSFSDPTFDSVSDMED